MGTPGLYCAIPSIVLIVIYPNKLYIDYARSIKLNLKLGIWSSGMLHKCWLKVSWWHFRTAYQSLLQGYGAGCLTLKMRLICCPKMSVPNYQSMLCNFPEQRRTLTLQQKPEITCETEIIIWFVTQNCCFSYQFYNW